jgi:hypothetical protein
MTVLDGVMTVPHTALMTQRNFEIEHSSLSKRISDLRIEAGLAGDRKQIELCDEALEDLRWGRRDSAAVCACRDVLAETGARAEAVRCECGEIYGERCEWSGPKTETVRVDVMPVHLRASHEAAGNSGRYPANGSRRLRVHSDCADRLVETEGEWATRG